MSSIAVAPQPVPPASADEDRFVLLPGVDWRTYRVLRELLDSRGLQMTYLEGALEIRTLSGRHDLHKTRIARLLELFALEADVPLSGYGSTTFRHVLKERGLEPDECYAVGRDLTDDDEFPDIALEVVLTSGGINKLEIYREMGVREVWYWYQGAFRIFELTSDGYRQREDSGLVPGLDFAELARLADEPDQHAVLKAFRDRLRKR